MSQAEDLLESLPTYYAGTTPNENHIVIGRDRFLIVPEELRKIAVQHDHNIETLTFDCPRYWDQHDMSKMRVYVNYMRSDDEVGSDLATNIVADENDETIMHFDWTVTGHLTAVHGPVTILVCIQKVNKEDGTEQNHWNSELCTDMYVSEGMECEADVVAHYPGIITSLLHRMDVVEDIATVEAMQGYVTKYMTENDEEIRRLIHEDVSKFMSENENSIPEAMQQYVNEYLDGHPTLFVIGPDKPGVACLWFDTSGEDPSTVEENTVVKMSGNDSNDGMYAVVEEAPVTIYDFDII